mmetsp:Transcript_22426/g.31394  ORF Transcript_22426/g.31394 Transcript_22426/m.31394 type:complete len:127 (-) Transcript_22426:86-466(-)
MTSRFQILSIHRNIIIGRTEIIIKYYKNIGDILTKDQAKNIFTKKLSLNPQNFMWIKNMSFQFGGTAVYITIYVYDKIEKFLNNESRCYILREKLLKLGSCTKRRILKEKKNKMVKLFGTAKLKKV